MKTYYEHAGIAIYHGDCREVLPTLGKFDLLVTDPPYGIGYQSSWRTVAFRQDKIVGDNCFPMWLFDLKPEVAMLVWCRWDNLYEIPKPRSFIVWDKGTHSMGDLSHEFGRQWEGCAFYPGSKHVFTHRPPDLIRISKIRPDLLRHPAEKPVGVLKFLLACHDGNVLDPFMGSGSTLRAAKDLRRQAIGIEVEERYCEIAAKRMEQEVLDFDG